MNADITRLEIFFCLKQPLNYYLFKTTNFANLHFFYYAGNSRTII